MIALAAVAVLLLAGCSGTRDQRLLPEDRGQAIVYVALGDSTVEGVGATRPETTYVSRLHERLRAVYPGARLANLGVAGATSADVVREQLPRAVELEPRLVTVSVGPNDVTAGIPAKEYERNVDRLLATLARRTRTVIVVSLLPDLAVTPRFSGSAAREAVGRQTVLFNEALRRQARAHGAALVDVYAASHEEVPRRPELMAGDGYHPSDHGYARWAELMWAAVESRIARR